MAKLPVIKNFKAYIMVFVCVIIFSVITFSSDSGAPKHEEEVVSPQSHVEAEPEIISEAESEAEGRTEVSKPEEYEEVQSEDTKEYIFSLSYPVNGEIIAGFSGNELVYSPTLDDWRVHNGVDIRADFLERVYASERGVIERVYEDELMGKTVIIDHQNGYKTVYSNLSSTEMVDKGETVEKGTVISGVGESALAESSLEPHVHFQVIKDGVAVNPEEYTK